MRAVRLLPTPICEAAGLRVSADPRGFVLFETPLNGAHLTPENSLCVAFKLIELHAPSCMEAIRRDLAVPHLRVVRGGDAA